METKYIHKIKRDYTFLRFYIFVNEMYTSISISCVTFFLEFFISVF